MQPVPVLTYHAANISGNEYASNDHVALAADLRSLDRWGFRVVPLAHVVDALDGARRLPDRAVAITLDDGTDFDFRDLEHPVHGPQRSMLNVLRDFRATAGDGAQPGLHATAFVVASPQARDAMDRGCLAGRGWFGDAWWGEAVASGLMDVANHSWDHNHPCVEDRVCAAHPGSFACVGTRELADREIRRAHDFIRTAAPNRASSLFAYPYGHVNEYLVTAYFPLGEPVTGTRAAFGTQPAHITAAANRWSLPRYVFGPDWSTPDGLQRLLRQG